MADIAIYILGVIGVPYCIYHIFVFCCRPIKRDWILAKGNFLIKVVNFVLLIPFVVTLSITLPGSLRDDKSFSPKNLVFEEKLYNDKTVSDTEISQQVSPSLFWTVYYHFIDPGNQHMTTSESGRRDAALIAILGYILLNGLLISTLISWFDRRRDQWKNGEIRYRRLAFYKKKVAVVIGANESAPFIIDKLLKNYGEKVIDYVILLTNEDVGKVRDQISSYLNKYDEERVIIYNGQLDSIEEIYNLHISEETTEIYVLGESSNDDVSQSYHDTQNMKCIHNIASYLTDRCVEKKIVCRVMFEYQTTYSVFQFSDLPNNIRQHLIFIPFNTYENWAQRVLVEGCYTETVKKVLPAQRRLDEKPIWTNHILHSLINGVQAMMPKNNEELRTIEYSPLDGTGITPTSKEYVHLVVVGMSKMGVAMAIQAAQVAHYPNFTTSRKVEANGVIRTPSPLRTRITFIDEDAENEMNFFMGRYQNLFALSRHRYIDASGKEGNIDEPWVDAMTTNDCQYKMQGDNFIDIEWEFVKGNVQSPGVMQYLKRAAHESGCSLENRSLLTIAICHPLAHEAIAAALYMPQEVYDNALQILVYQREASDIIYNLSNKEDMHKHKRYAKLRPFGMQYADFTMDKDTYYKSQLCNYVYKLIFNNKIDNKTIPDILYNMDLSNKEEEHVKTAREEWKKLAIFDKWSNRYLSNSFRSKLRSIGGNYDDITAHYPIICSLFEKHKMEMAECEHNRWNVQQLLMGFRAYKDDELVEYKRLKDNAQSSSEAQASFKEFKNKMKTSPEKVHLNICSISTLHELDVDAEGYDEVFNASIPAILKCIENRNKKNNNNA